MIILLVLSAVLLLWLTAVPLAVLVLTSVRPAGTYGFSGGTLTLQNFHALFSQGDLSTLLLNTAVYVSGTIAIAAVFAALWSWITERTDFRFKMPVRVLMMLVMGLPPIIQGFGWTLLLNPNNGYVNHLIRTVLDLDVDFGPINIYSMGMMTVVSGFLLTPSVYLMLSGVVRNLDYKLEFPAVLAGVHPVRVLTHIVGPVLLPGLLSVLIYTVMVMIQVFDIPLSIGLTAGIQVLSTRIYLLSTAELGAPNYNLAAAFGVFLVGIAVVLMAIYRRLTRMAEKFSVISGKQYRAARAELGLRRYLVYLYGIAFFAVSLAPILILLWASLIPFYRLPSLSALSSVSLQNYAELFTSSLFHRGLINTLIVVVSGSTIAVLVSLLVAYVGARTRGVLSQIVDTLAFLPIAIPHIVLGLAVLLLYVRTPIYGTVLAIILAQVSVNMVFGVRTIAAALIQIHRDLERAAEICGVRRLVTIALIIVPIIRSQIVNAWLFVFAHAMRDLAIPLVFLTSQTVVLSSALWLIWGYPNIPGAAALSMVLVLFLVALVIPVQIYASRLDAKAG